MSILAASPETENEYIFWLKVYFFTVPIERRRSWWERRKRTGHRMFVLQFVQIQRGRPERKNDEIQIISHFSLTDLVCVFPGLGGGEGGSGGRPSFFWSPSTLACDWLVTDNTEL